MNHMATRRAQLSCTFFTLLLAFSGVSANAASAKGDQIMVSAPSPFAVEVAREIAKDGGNVADVAVAMGLTLAVTSPYYASLGGGGFALIKMDERIASVDFRETAPAATNPEFYSKKAKDASLYGGTAVGTPGFPAGLLAIHKKYGKLPWKRLFQTPLRLASQGFKVPPEWVKYTAEAKKHFTPIAKKIFFKPGGGSYATGEVFRQPKLAAALKLLQESPEAAFYSGAIAKDLVKSIRATGGVLSEADLKDYHVRWLEPLTTQFRGYKISLMPPPSSGGVVIMTALRLVEKTGVEKTGALSADEAHLLGEILNRSFRGRALLGDPDFHRNPLGSLLGPPYISELVKSIHTDRVASLAPLKENSREGFQTTHFSVMDKAGHAIALTVTLNGEFGSGVVSEKYGIALNNEMDDFTTSPGKPNLYGLVQGTGNLVQPGKRPLSSMSPTIIEKDGRTVMALGAPGGPRIISSVFQTIYRRLVNNMDLDQAIQAPRVHNQFDPATLYVDQKLWAQDVLDQLAAKGHKIEGSWMAKVYAVELLSDGTLSAAYDSRGEGAVGGL